MCLGLWPDHLRRPPDGSRLELATPAEKRAPQAGEVVGGAGQGQFAPHLGQAPQTEAAHPATD